MAQLPFFGSSVGLARHPLARRGGFFLDGNLHGTHASPGAGPTAARQNRGGAGPRGGDPVCRRWRGRPVSGDSTRCPGRWASDVQVGELSGGASGLRGRTPAAHRSPRLPVGGQAADRGTRAGRCHDSRTGGGGRHRRQSDRVRETATRDRRKAVGTERRSSLAKSRLRSGGRRCPANRGFVAKCSPITAGPKAVA